MPEDSLGILDLETGSMEVRFRRTGYAGYRNDPWYSGRMGGLSKHGQLEFSKEGRRLYFDTAPRPAPENDPDTIEDEEVELDFWNWKEPLMQPMQLVQLYPINTIFSPASRSIICRRLESAMKR